MSMIKITNYDAYDNGYETGRSTDKHPGGLWYGNWLAELHALDAPDFAENWANGFMVAVHDYDDSPTWLDEWHSDFKAAFDETAAEIRVKEEMKGYDFGKAAATDPESFTFEAGVTLGQAGHSKWFITGYMDGLKGEVKK